MSKKKYITTRVVPGAELICTMKFLNKILPEYEFIISTKPSQLLILKDSRMLQEERNVHNYEAVIVFSGEPLYSKEYWWLSMVFYFMEFFVSKALMRKLFYFLLRRRRDLTCMFFIYRQRFSHIEKFIKNSSTHVYSIVSSHLRENIRSKNVMSMPYFISSNCVLEKYVSQTSLLNQQSYREYKQRKFCALAVGNLNKLHTFDIYACLNQYKTVDFYGGIFLSSLGNFPGGHEDTPRCYQTYKFVIAAENTCSENYITEKIFRALEGSSLPIYWGAPNIKDYVNEQRFVCAQDYKNYRALRERIKTLDQDHDQYMHMISQPIFTEKNIENIHKAEQKARTFLLKVLEKIK